MTEQIDYIPDELYASLCFPTNSTTGREITPPSDLFNTAPGGGGVQGGIGLQAFGVELRVAATCWVRQYRVFTNAISSSELADSKGWLHFCHSAREPQLGIVIIELQIINPEIRVNPSSPWELQTIVHSRQTYFYLFLLLYFIFIGINAKLKVIKQMEKRRWK